MRHVRVRGPQGVENGLVQDRQVVTEGGSRIEPLDLETLQLPEPWELLAPIEAPEVWCAELTYERAPLPRPAPATFQDAYAAAHDAPRPVLVPKDASMRRTVGPGRPIGIRDDSTWNVPEPEIGLVIGTHGRIAGITLGTDVASRDIEGVNPLYLPQARIYAGACAIGPAVYAGESLEKSFHIRMRVTDEWGKITYEGDTYTANMRRSFGDLVRWLLLDNPVPPGSVLLTGAALVPPDSFTLLPGHFVETHVPEIGALVNPVVRAAELIEREPVA